MDYRALSIMELESQPFPVVQQDFRIYVSEEAFDSICRTANNTHEVGGILVGNALRDESGPYIRVDDVIEALHAEESGTELTLTHATWNHIHEQMDTIHAGKRIIGWYHTHPDFGIFLSERDRFIQQSFFDLPFQIALVYDPVRREHGVFNWRDNQPWRARRYWVGMQEHAWDGPRDFIEGEAHKRKASAKTEDPEVKPAIVHRPAPKTLFDQVNLTWALVTALIGLALGVALGMRLGGNPNTMLKARAQGAQEAIASLNTDLLGVIRETLSDDALAKTFDEGLNQLDHAVEKIKPLEASNPALSPALQSVYDAQGVLRRARNDRRLAHEMLSQIEKIARQSNRTPEAVARDLTTQRAALGGIYAELAQDAARGGDKDRATRLLEKAAAIDPDHYGDYDKQLKSFNPQGTLSQPAPSAEPAKPQENTPAPSAPQTSAAWPGNQSDTAKKT